MQKNILQIGKFSKFSFGGIELVTKIIADSADLSSIETICFGKHDKVFSKKYREFLTNFTISSQPISFSLIKFLIYKINKYDLILFHYPNPLVALFLIIFCKKNEIIIFWHSDIVRKKGILFHMSMLVEKFLIRKSKKIIFTSNEYLKSSNSYKYVKDKVVIIPLGIEELPVKRDVSKLNNDKIKLIFIGRLVEYKGLINFLKIISPFDNIHISIIGNGPLAKDISKYKDVDNFKPSIKMYGKVNDEKKIMLLKDSNFLILPSLSRAEAYGLVLLEAMRLGVPIITNNLKGSGVIELNSDYESKPVGFKFDSSNIEKARSAFKNILSISQEEYEEVSRQALRKFKKKYTDAEFISNIKLTLIGKN